MASTPPKHSDSNGDDALGKAIDRISERVAQTPTVDTVILAVTEEWKRPGADVRAIKLFGQFLFEAIRKRHGEPITSDALQQAIDQAIRGMGDKSASR
jgi:hypothetical protein